MLRMADYVKAVIAFCNHMVEAFKSSERNETGRASQEQYGLSSFQNKRSDFIFGVEDVKIRLDLAKPADLGKIEIWEVADAIPLS